MDPLTSFHKLYQIKFTELVFGDWSGISELLAEYFRLVSELVEILILDAECSTE